MIVVDTGPVVAAYDARDARHDESAHLIRTAYIRGEKLVVPGPVICEAAHLINVRHGPSREADVLRFLSVSNTFTVDNPTSADIARTADLIATYRDSNIGYVDAAVIAVAERLHVTKIATLDLRHFAIIRPQHCDTFELLP